MKNWKGILLGCAALTLSAAAPGCGNGDAVSEAEGFQTEAARNEFVVDMAKVNELYGTSSKYFLGIAHSESGLPEGLPGAGPVIWDQTALRESDGSLHVESGTDYAVKDAEGKLIDPKGYVKLIPMLRDTDPKDQTHIKAALQDGDVLVYFHPEDTQVNDQMERRASHVAMHYEYKDRVHHIDNPNSYGPRYNHSPTRHMPFHVYRFKPSPERKFSSASASGGTKIEGVSFSSGQGPAALKIANEASFEDLDGKFRLYSNAAEHIVRWRTQHGFIDSLETLGRVPYVGPAALTRLKEAAPAGADTFTISEEMASQYGYAARNWAFVTNDISPFADFFTLNLQSKTDLADFKTKALNGDNIPRVYCSGLAYTNLNLALNYPKNANGIGSDYAAFESGITYFSDTNEYIRSNTLTDAADLRSIDRLIFEPYGATDIVSAWAEVYLAHLPPPVRLALLQDPNLQSFIVGGFSKLEWSDASSPEKQQRREFTPANIQNVRRWARAYGQTAEYTKTYLDADQAEVADNADVDSLKTLLSQLDPPLPIDGLTPMDVLQAIEIEKVDNRFVPPRIWMDDADRADSDMVYVGTVVNCELLSAIDGETDPCAGGDSGSNAFSEGAADTSTYTHYGIGNGGERTHRRFDASPGPELMGPETRITVRATSPDASDLQFLLHIPEHYEGHASSEMSQMEYDRFCTAENGEGGSGTCAPSRSIVLAAGAAVAQYDDETISFRLGDICTMVDEMEAMVCPVAERTGASTYTLSSAAVSRNAHGLFSVTMTDLGGSDAAASLANCPSCETGGAQFNQWVLDVRAD